MTSMKPPADAPTTDGEALSPVSTEMSGRFRILGELGGGRSSHVCLALDGESSASDRIRVVKRPRPEYFAAKDSGEAFLAGAQIAARLDHPNIVRTFGVTAEQGLPCVAMEYLEGQPFSKMIAECGPLLTMPMQLRIIADTLAGLHHAHELTAPDGKCLGIVHGDVSPEKVFVTFDGQVKILGLFKAKPLAPASRAGATGGSKPRALDYVPPEQITSDELDRRADVYGAGVMLWEAIAGRRMWKDVPEESILRRVLLDDMPSLRAAKANVPPALEAICSKALSVDRDDRYATAAEFKAALEEIIEKLQITVSRRAIGTMLSIIFDDVRATMRRLVDRHTREEAPPSSDPGSRPMDGGAPPVPAEPRMHPAPESTTAEPPMAAEPPSDAAPTEPQSDAAPTEPQSATAPTEPQSDAAPTEPQSATATTEPQSATATTEPQSATATTEPQSATATTEPQSATATTEPQSDAAPAEPQSATATTEPQSDAAPAEPQSATVTQVATNVASHDAVTEPTNAAGAEPAKGIVDSPVPPVADAQSKPDAGLRVNRASDAWRLAPLKAPPRTVPRPSAKRTAATPSDVAPAARAEAVAAAAGEVVPGPASSVVTEGPLVAAPAAALAAPGNTDSGTHPDNLQATSARAEDPYPEPNAVRIAEPQATSEPEPERLPIATSETDAGAEASAKAHADAPHTAVPTEATPAPTVAPPPTLAPAPGADSGQAPAAPALSDVAPSATAMPAAAAAPTPASSDAVPASTTVDAPVSATTATAAAPAAAAAEATPAVAPAAPCTSAEPARAASASGEPTAAPASDASTTAAPDPAPAIRASTGTEPAPASIPSTAAAPALPPAPSALSSGHSSSPSSGLEPTPAPPFATAALAEPVPPFATAALAEPVPPFAAAALAEPVPPFAAAAAPPFATAAAPPFATAALAEPAPPFATAALAEPAPPFATAALAERETASDAPPMVAPDAAREPSSRREAMVTSQGISKTPAREGLRRYLWIGGSIAAFVTLLLLRSASRAPTAPPAPAAPPPRPSSEVSASHAPPAKAEEPPPKRVQVRLAAHPREAKLYLDGELLPSNPFEAAMVTDGGAVHAVRAEAKGYTSSQTNIQLEADVALVLSLQRPKAVPAPPPAAPPRARPKGNAPKESPKIRFVEEP